MLGLPSSANVLKGLEDPNTDSTSCLFIEKGHIVEYIEMNSKKIVCLFFGPDEFVIPCHPTFSILKSLDDVHCGNFSHQGVISILRKHPESFVLYRGVRKDYYEKVAIRLRMQGMPVEKRLEHLQKTRSWVFGLVDPKDIANYLGIPLSLFEKLVR
jgi:hypothetical protein